MTNLFNACLLYRASLDGFESQKFHNKCDGVENTLTIIQDNFNNVFGGYTSARWTSDSSYLADSTAFIFSLRRAGVSCRNKFKIKNDQYAILGNLNYGPIFGIYDLLIKDKSNLHTGSCSILFHVYDRPLEYSELNSHLVSSLSSNFNSWLTTDIEVYQIYK